MVSVVSFTFSVPVPVPVVIVTVSDVGEIFEELTSEAPVTPVTVKTVPPVHDVLEPVQASAMFVPWLAGTVVGEQVKLAPPDPLNSYASRSHAPLDGLAFGVKAGQETL